MYNDIVEGITRLGFPIAITVFLLWEGSKLYKAIVESLKGMTKELSKITIALYLILDKLDALDSYEKAIRTLKEDE